MDQTWWHRPSHGHHFAILLEVSDSGKAPTAAVSSQARAHPATKTPRPGKEGTRPREPHQKEGRDGADLIWAGVPVQQESAMLGCQLVWIDVGGGIGNQLAEGDRGGDDAVKAAAKTY